MVLSPLKKVGSFMVQIVQYLIVTKDYAAVKHDA